MKTSYVGNAFLLVVVTLLCFTVRRLTKANAELTGYISTTLTKLEQNQDRLSALQSEQMATLYSDGSKAFALDVLSDCDK